jgi:hypothetical protein
MISHCILPAAVVQLRLSFDRDEPDPAQAALTPCTLLDDT